MKIDVKEQKKNPLMNRDEFVINIDHSGKPTPSRHDILKEIAKEVKASEDLIIIDKILSGSGVPVSVANTFVYKKKDDIPKGKLEKMKRRMEKKKKGEASPEPAQEAAKEAPKEEFKESSEAEKPAEETKEIVEETKEEKPAEECKEAPKEVEKAEKEPKDEKTVEKKD